MLEDQLQKKNYIIQNVNVKLKFIQLILAIFSMLNQFPCKILIKWLKLLKYICYYGKILIDDFQNFEDIITIKNS